jgi:hypothetical protein
VVGSWPAVPGSGCPNAQDAAEKARLKQAELAAAHNGLIPKAPVVESAPQRTTLASALGSYKEYVQYHRSVRTFRTCRPMLDGFKEFCTKTYIEEVERQDLLDFATHLKKEGQQGKSIYNKLGGSLAGDEAAWQAKAPPGLRLAELCRNRPADL